MSDVEEMEIPEKKPRLTEISPDESTKTKVIPVGTTLEPKYLVQVDEVNKAVFIAIPSTNPARKIEMDLVAKIVQELNISPSNYSRSIVRLIGTTNSNKVYEGGEEHHWERDDPPLSTTIVVKKIVAKKGLSGSAVKHKVNEVNKVDQQRQLLQKMKAQRTQPPVPVGLNAATISSSAKPSITISDKIFAKESNPEKSPATSKTLVPSGKSLSSLSTSTVKTTGNYFAKKTSVPSLTAKAPSFGEIKIESDDDDANDNDAVTQDCESVGAPATATDDCVNPPFQIVEWSRVEVPVQKDSKGRIFFSTKGKYLGIESTLDAYHMNLTTDKDFYNWTFCISPGADSIKVLSIYKMTTVYKPMSIQRSIQMFSDGTIMIAINSKDCTEEFMKKMSIKNYSDIKALMNILSTAKVCSGSIGFDIVVSCADAVREGKVWYSDSCTKVIFDSTDSTCGPCHLVRNRLRIEKSKLYRQVHEKDQENLQAAAARQSGLNGKTEKVELGKAIYEMIGGFWEELKIEEEAKAQKAQQDTRNNIVILNTESVTQDTTSNYVLLS